MTNKFGKKAFTPYLGQRILKFLNKLVHLHSGEIVSFKDKDGNELKSTLTKVTNLNDFIKEISDVRGINNPQIILGADGDLEKCIVTCIIKEEGYEVDDEDIGLKDFKPTGQKRVLTIAKADGVPEIRANVEILLDSLNLPELTEDFQLVCDLKLANIILGIQSCSSLYSCPYCEGSKVDKDGKPTSGRGCWQPGELRTLRNITANQSEWALKTNSNRKQLKNFKSCEFQPFPSEKIMKMMLFSSNFLQILFMSTT